MSNADKFRTIGTPGWWPAFRRWVGIEEKRNHKLRLRYLETAVNLLDESYKWFKASEGEVDHMKERYDSLKSHVERKILSIETEEHINGR